MRKSGLIGMVFVMLFGAGLLPLAAVYARKPAPTLLEQCARVFAETQVCPEETCRLVEEPREEGPAVRQCLALACTEIAAEDCPQDYCVVMTNCSGEEICHYPMQGGQPACGNLAYAGQDVECCKGLVQRCGIEFLDGTCDMEGVNSVYNLPICIPCGDGICTNFENRCNCPEDCGVAPDFD